MIVKFDIFKGVVWEVKKKYRNLKGFMWVFVCCVVISL